MRNVAAEREIRSKFYHKAPINTDVFSVIKEAEMGILAEAGC